MNYRRIVPNTISGISLVLGVVSIFYTLEENYFLAAVCIVLSVAADSQMCIRDSCMGCHWGG